MARCLTLEDYSVEVVEGRCYVTLEAWGTEHLDSFVTIVGAAFPEAKFRRTTARPQTFLGLQRALRLVGDRPNGGTPAVLSLLELVHRSLTIEDSLDESHALGYHRDEDEATGKLTRSALGQLVNDAKYNNSRSPRETIGHALCEFITTHPRYARAKIVASIPAHARGRASGLSGRLARQVSDALGHDYLPISRARTRPEQKTITDEDRSAGVKKRFANQANTMEAPDDVQDAVVVVIDDLYGSGGTMGEAASALRAAGAREVLGLAVTKQRLFGGISASGRRDA